MISYLNEKYCRIMFLCVHRKCTLFSLDDKLSNLIFYELCLYFYQNICWNESRWAQSFSRINPSEDLQLNSFVRVFCRTIWVRNCYCWLPKPFDCIVLLYTYSRKHIAFFHKKNAEQYKLHKLDGRWISIHKWYHKNEWILIEHRKTHIFLNESN